MALSEVKQNNSGLVFIPLDNGTSRVVDARLLEKHSPQELKAGHGYNWNIEDPYRYRFDDSRLIVKQKPTGRGSARFSTFNTAISSLATRLNCFFF